MVVYHIAFEVYPFSDLYKSLELIVYYIDWSVAGKSGNFGETKKYTDNGNKGHYDFKSQLQLRMEIGHQAVIYLLTNKQSTHTDTCTHTDTYTHIHVHKQIHICTYTHTCTQTDTHKCTCMLEFTHIHIHAFTVTCNTLACLLVWVCTCVCVRVCIFLFRTAHVLTYAGIYEY